MSLLKKHMMSNKRFAFPDNFDGYYDGQFLLDISNEILRREFYNDLEKKRENPDVFYCENENGLLLAEAMQWDSKYFGINCHKLSYLIAQDVQTADRLLDSYLEWSRKNNVEYLFCRTQTKSTAFLNSLFSKGFELAFNKLMLRAPIERARSVPESDPSISVVPFERKYASFVERNARQAFVHNRFVNDSRIDQKQVPGIYEQWAENFMMNQPEHIGVAIVGNSPVGSVIFDSALRGYSKEHLQPLLPEGLISLIAVDSSARSKGVGSTLLGWAIDSLQSRYNCRVVYANTALNNIGSLLMFQKTGFQVFSALSECRLYLS